MPTADHTFTVITRTKENNRPSGPPPNDLSGTSTRVMIHLMATDGRQFEAKLNNPGVNDFVAGNTDRFTITGPDINPIWKIGIRFPSPVRGQRWRWTCEWIYVKDETAGYDARIENEFVVNVVDTILWKDALAGPGNLNLGRP